MVKGGMGGVLISLSLSLCPQVDRPDWPLVGTKLHCLVIKALGCEQLA